MFNIRCVLRTCSGLVMTQLRNPRIYIGLALATVIAYIPTKSYLDYSMSINEKICIFEPFIIVGSLRQYMTMIFLGLLFMNSNAPYVDDSTTYIVVRCNRYNWTLGCILYIVVSTIAFYTLILAITAIISLKHGLIVNAWSQPMYVLSQLGSRSVYMIYNIYFNYDFITINMLPVSAMLKTFILLSSYSVCITGIMFALNLWLGNFTGTICAVIIHLLGYVVLSDGIGKTINYVPLINALLGRHNIAVSFQGDSIYFSLKYFIVFFAVIMFSLFAINRFTDFKIYSGKRK